MTETNLKEYQIELKGLLQQGRHDEVVEHCRHILKTYPRNVNVYRLLGQALLESGRYEEAEQIFRRVLSVYPADLDSHRGLSEIAQHQRRYDHAIWHLERAYEQDTSNTNLLKQLRDLYATHRNLPNPRVQLTARAVAEQQRQSGMLHLAIETLQNALQAAANRIDLRLFLARLLWEEGRKIEAAEEALDVLRVLPDSVEANRILTELWLSEQRPSDAQRYLGRIEAVAPYLAYQMVQGEFPRDDAFRLNRLDYQQEASRRLTTAEPDWLQSLSGEEGDFDNADSGWLDLIEDDDSFSESVLIEPDESDEESDAIDVDDWLSELDDVQEVSEAQTRAVIPPEHVEDMYADLFGDVSKESDWDPTETPVRRRSTGMTDLLSSLEDQEPEIQAGSDEFETFDEEESDEFDLFAEQQSGTGLTGLLSEPDEEPERDRSPGRVSTGLTGLLRQLDQSDDKPVAEADLSDERDLSLSDTSYETQSDMENAAEDIPSSQEIPQTDMLSGGYNMVEPDEVDPLAWMRDSGVELVDEPASRQSFSPYAEEDDGGDIRDSHERDPLAWLQSSGVELTDEESKEFVSAVSADDEEEVDPLAWMLENGIDLIDAEDDDAQESDPLDWMQDDDVLLSDYQTGKLPDEDLPSPRAAQSPVDESSVDQDDVDWLTDDSLLDEALYMEALSTGDFPAVATDSDDRQEDMADDTHRPTPDWNNEPDDDEQAADVPIGWSAESSEEEHPESGWLPQDADAADDLFGAEDAVEEEAQPDWLSGFGAAEPQGTPYSAAGADDEEEDPGFDASLPFDWEQDDENEPLEVSDGPDWLTMVSDEPTGETEPIMGQNIEPEETTPDWLSEVGSAGAGPVDLPFDENEREIDEILALDWDEVEESSAEDQQEDVPAWLAGVGAAGGYAMMSQGETEDADDEQELEWLSTLESGGSDEEAPSEQIEAGETPDWLAAARPPEGDQGSFQDDQIEESEEAEPDWLSSLGGTDDDELEFDVEESEAAEVEGGIPDWLSGMRPEDEPESEKDEVSEAAIPAWLQDVGTGTDSDFEEDEAEEVPSWLSGVGTQSSASTSWEDAEDEESEEDVPDWLSGIEAEDQDEFALETLDEEAQPEETPDWLVTLNANRSAGDAGSIEEESLDWEASEQDEAFDFSDEEEAVEPARELPDWLAGVQPAPASVSDEFDEDIPDLTWDEEAEPVSSGANIFDEIDEDQDLIDADQISAYDYDESEAVVPSPAENAPDWLNAMVPGLDLDYDSREDEYEEAYEAEPYSEAESRREYGWLNDIVQEELAPPVTMPDESGARPRFVFTRLPLWQRVPGATSSGRDDRNGDSQAGDDDLPPWLSFENE
jgi:tetratricopeptide (TPR) repeat protein